MMLIFRVIEPQLSPIWRQRGADVKIQKELKTNLETPIKEPLKGTLKVEPP